MWARIGSLSVLSKHLGNASQVCVVARKRRPGGVWAVGVVRARGGVGTHVLAAIYILSKHSTNATRCG